MQSFILYQAAKERFIIIQGKTFGTVHTRFHGMVVGLFFGRTRRRLHKPDDFGTKTYCDT